MSNFKNLGFVINKNDVKTNFTKVPNEVINLSIDPYQKLVLIYLYSKPEGFTHYQTFMGNALGISRQTVSRCLDDLTDSGYLVTKDRGKTYSLVLTGLTRDVNQINTGGVNQATTDVKMATIDVGKLTRDVNQINTNKKIEISKTEYKEGEIKKGLIKTVEQFFQLIGEDGTSKLIQHLDFNTFIKDTDKYFNDDQYNLQLSILDELRRLKRSKDNPTKKGNAIPVDENNSTKGKEIRQEPVIPIDRDRCIYQQVNDPYNDLPYNK